MEDNFDEIEQLNKLQVASRKVDRNAEAVARKIAREKTLEGVQDLTHLFNVAQVKKQVIRTLEYNQLLDSITQQMKERLDKRADQFSNKDLLDYAKVITDSMDKAQKQIQTVDSSPMIQINQQNNTVVVEDSDLDRESRRKIMLAAQAAMEFLKSQGTLPKENEVFEEDSENILENVNFEDEEVVYNIEDEEDETFDIQVDEE